MNVKARFLVEEPVAYILRFWLHSSGCNEALDAFVHAVDWKRINWLHGERCYVLTVTPPLLMLLAEVHAEFGVPGQLECFRNVQLTPKIVTCRLETWAWALDVMQQDDC